MSSFRHCRRCGEDQTTHRPRPRCRFRRRCLLSPLTARSKGYRTKPYQPKGRAALVAAVLAAFYSIVDSEWPLTARGIFYRLISMTADFGKSKQTADAVAEVIVELRRDRTIPWRAIRDDGYHRIDPYSWEDEVHFLKYMRTKAQRARLRRQDGQRLYVEVWAEAAGVLPVVERAAEAFGVPVLTGGGQPSVTLKHDMARRAAERFRKEGRSTVVLGVTDHDPYGWQMVDNVRQDTAAFLADDGFPEALTIDRIAITVDQVREYGITMMQAPVAGAHSPRSVREWQGGIVQVEAMLPSQLRVEVTTAIETRFDMAAYRAVLVAERGFQQRLLALIPGLPG